MSAAPPGPTTPELPGSPDGQRPNRQSPKSPPPSPAANRNSEPRAVPQVPDHELLRPIGRGAYGVVWLARNVVGTLRAVKVVYRQDFAEAHPFEREFHGLQKFEPVSRAHEGFVDLLQIGRNDAAGYFYYVMELADAAEVSELAGERVSGRGSPECVPPLTDTPTHSLTHPRTHLPADSPSRYIPRTLRHELKARGRLPVEECVRIGLALTSALEHLHAAGLVHRDIKPSNIIFVQGAPKLADIGLVADVGDAQSIVGTEGYIAPEGPGTPQADLYALGKVFYEMAMGRDRREFPNLPDDLAGLPDRQALMEFNEIVARACARHADGRYHTAGELLADLRRLHGGESIRRRHSVEQAMRRARRLAPAVGLVALLVLALPIIWRRQQTPRAPPAEKASVFVLPFRNAGTNQTGDDLRSRITDAFIDSLDLLKGQGLRVGPRKSDWVNRDEDELRRQVGRDFRMSHVLTGRARVEEPAIDLRLTLYATGKDHPLWTETYAGTTND